MIISILVGAAIGYVLGAAIAEICLNIGGIITSRKIKKEVRKQAELNYVKKFLVTQVEQTTAGPKIHIDGKNSQGEVIAHLIVQGGSSTILRKNEIF